MKKIKIKVIPNSRQESVSIMANGLVKVKVSPLPEKGRANQRVLELLAKKYDVRIDSVNINKGHKNEIKEIIIS